MLEDRQVERSRAIQRRTGPTFYFATKFLPERVRDPTHVLYAFFRIADEVVDDAEAMDRPAAEKRATLESFRAEALGEAEPSGPVLEAFREVKEAHDIPDDEVHAFVDAMATDVEKHRYADVTELREYMRGSAAAVGAMMTAIMEPTDRDRAMPHAKALGEAFQLTNFLRDVREDVVDRDRIYIPLRTLEHHGVEPARIERLEFDDDVAAAIRAELDRTERFYRHGVAGIETLPDDCQFPVLLAAVLYADYHRAIRAADYDVLSDPPSLTRRRTLSLFARTRARWQFNRDPAAVFDAVSPISMHAGEDRDPTGERLTLPTS
jgi:phytoene synthase